MELKAPSMRSKLAPFVFVFHFLHWFQITFCFWFLTTPSTISNFFRRQSSMGISMVKYSKSNIRKGVGQKKSLERWRHQYVYPIPSHQLTSLLPCKVLFRIQSRMNHHAILFRDTNRSAMHSYFSIISFLSTLTLFSWISGCLLCIQIRPLNTHRIGFTSIY